MADTRAIFAVVNPHAGGGRGAALVEPALRHLRASGGELTYGLTEKPGDEARLTGKALAEGFRRIVAVGGDGTLSNVANVLLASRADAVLGHIPAGTGCDLARAVGLPAADVAACVRIVAAGVTRRLDVGRIEGRFFLNVVGFGLDVAVLEHSWTVRRVPRPLVYLYSSLCRVFSYDAWSAAMEADGRDLGRGRRLIAVIANGPEFGGGLRVAPGASLDDGRLDVVTIRDTPPWRRLPLLLRLKLGRHESQPEVSRLAASSVRLRFDAPPAYERDGEWHQAATPEVAIDVLPRALALIVP